MRTNRPSVFGPLLTGGGGQAMRITPLKELRRSCLSSMLFEDTAYEKGSVHATRIQELVKSVKPEEVAALAVECREAMYLRHIPLFLVRELARIKGNGTLVADTLEAVINRPDELTEYLALYWRDDPNAPLSAGSKRGLARAFRKFDADTLAKYNRADAVKLKDVLRIVHPNPLDAARSEVWKKLITGKLESPDTWEVALSGGGDKKAVFERLLRERKLGGLAFLRNLRNMVSAKVDDGLIRDRFLGGFKYVLPFRFISAAKYAPKFEPEIEAAMLRTAGALPKLKGHTVLIIDVSGSMCSGLSWKSEMNRLDAATALAVLAREQCESVDIWCTAGSDGRRIHQTEMVPARKGMALRDVVLAKDKTLGGGGIFLVQCLDHIYPQYADRKPARIVVFTDEQDCDLKLKPEEANAFAEVNYLVNISTEKNGVGYGAKWIHVDGFSERILDYMVEQETGN